MTRHLAPVLRMDFVNRDLLLRAEPDRQRWETEWVGRLTLSICFVVQYATEPLLCFLSLRASRAVT